MKQIVSLFLLAILAGCSGIPISSKKPDNNSTYTVEYLFEYDGCKVYRFHDEGHYVYFTNCQGDVTSFVNDSTKARIENRIRVGSEVTLPPFQENKVP